MAPVVPVTLRGPQWPAETLGWLPHWPTRASRNASPVCPARLAAKAASDTYRHREERSPRRLVLHPIRANARRPGISRLETIRAAAHNSL